MHVVDHCERFPGQCLLTGKFDGTLVDTEIHLPRGERVYLHESVVIEAAKELGLVPAEDLSKVTIERDAALEALEQERGYVDLCELFRTQVAHTLEQGMVVGGRGNRVGLRPHPREKFVELGRSLRDQVDNPRGVTRPVEQLVNGDV
jgi:hypothetical protein